MGTIANVPSTPLNYSKTPREGPAAAPFVFNWSVQQTYTIDYEMYQNQSFLTLCQSIYVDNIANTYAVVLTIQGRSQQSITIPAQSQGYYTVLVSGPIKMQFTTNSSATATTNVFLINEPVMPAIWGPGVTSAVADPLPVTVSGVVDVAQTTNTYYGMTQATMTGSAIQLSTILPTSSPTSLVSLNLQADTTNATNITIGGSSVTSGVGQELSALGFKNYSYIDSTKIYVIGIAGTKLNIEAIN